jgi:hypothetical protein
VSNPHTNNSTLRRLLAWRWSVVLSIVFHGAVIGGSIYVSLAPSSPDSAPLKALPANAPRLLDDQFRAASTMSPKQKERAIEENLPALNAMKASEVKAMATLIENASTGGKAARAIEPKADANGEFDADSATIHDIRKITTKAGETVYEWVFMDRTGLTLRTIKTSGEMSESDRSAAKAFELTRESPNLRILLDSAVRIAVSVSEPTVTPPTSAPTTPEKKGR